MALSWGRPRWQRPAPAPRARPAGGTAHHLLAGSQPGSRI